ncbi:MAG: hypothetical protein HOP21_04370, partial [Methylotenera sp.]|nr:hypothetical protein [Methylotenera sp.]
MSLETPSTELRQDEIFTKPKRNSWRVMLPIVAVLVIAIWVALQYGVDKKAIAGGAVAYGIITSAFTWLVGVIGLIPFVGPLIVKVLSIGVIWLLNAIGYLVSYIAIKRGYSKDVLTYRGLTIALI